MIVSEWCKSWLDEHTIDPDHEERFGDPLNGCNHSGRRVRGKYRARKCSEQSEQCGRDGEGQEVIRGKEIQCA